MCRGNEMQSLPTGETGSIDADASAIMVSFHWTYKMDEISVAEAKEASVKSNEKICAS